MADISKELQPPVEALTFAGRSHRAGAFSPDASARAPVIVTVSRERAKNTISPDKKFAANDGTAVAP